MDKEIITKLIKAGSLLLAVVGINFAPEEVSKFSNAAVTVIGGVFTLVYALEALWKRKK